MTPAATTLALLLFWLIPGLLGLLAGTAFFLGRARVGLGLLIAGLFLGVLVRPFPLGVALVGVGFLLGRLRRY
ncbi:MAG: hypothetical protein ACUVQC_05200 [Thermaceae bacterium]